MNDGAILVLVTTAVCALLWHALQTLGYWLYKRVRLKQPAKFSLPGKISLVLTAIFFACFFYAMLVEPYWPEVTHTIIYSAKLPPASRGFRIAHITDVHCDALARLEPRVPDMIAAEKPDLITFSGDSINSKAGLANCKGLFSALSKIAPTYVVRGNWDTWFWPTVDLFGGTGVHELQGNSELMSANGIPIAVTGFPVGARHNPDPPGGVAAVKAVLDKVPKSSYSIFIYHYPDLIYPVSEAGADLYLAGHTHGGQVRLPLYGALITLSRYGKRFESGSYLVGNTNLYVSRGVGMEGGGAPRIRFLCRPEVTIVDIKPKQ
ncbi:MAG TPA: metallophosphoesterase [Chroococcales cyanobacterium]